MKKIVVIFIITITILGSKNAKAQGDMAYIPNVKAYFDNIKESNPRGSRNYVNLMISVHEGGVKNNHMVGGGHWFIASASAMPLLVSEGPLLSFLPGNGGNNPGKAQAEYFFSDRLGDIKCQNMVMHSGQPYFYNKTEMATLEFKYSPNNRGEISNINIFSGWGTGWRIKTASRIDNMLYGTLENGNVYSISYRLSPEDNGR
ncbi:MAG: hypothetical protein ABI266_06545 [Ginsengibacter sp.]